METIKTIQHVLLTLSAIFGMFYFYQPLYLVLPLIDRLFRRRKPRPAPEPVIPPQTRRYAVLVAARNEQAVLPYLLDSIRAQDYPADRFSVFVIADNCTDRTADVAREHGACVFERHDTTHVGKGYAISALLDNIRASGRIDDFDAFLVFDADNLLRSDYITEIDKTFCQGFPAVCGYRNSKNFMHNWVTAGYGLWYLHDCSHLNASRLILGVTCACTGTGFGFDRALLEQTGGWHFFTMVEDIEFDTWCAINHVRMGYCPTAVVYDEQPVTFRQSWVQRTRWVQGGLQVSFKYTGRLFRGLCRGTARQRWACFECLTLTLCGYGVFAVLGVLICLFTLLAGGPHNVLLGVGLPLVGMYMGLFAMGGLTTLQEWSSIPGSFWRKMLSAVTFPIYMLTYLPIALCALFRKFRWQAVPHTVAMGVDQLPPELRGPSAKSGGDGTDMTKL